MKVFNNILEEEQLFPYSSMSLEEARKLRYYFSNLPAFSNGEIVQMGLKIHNDKLKANGLYAEEGNNLAFDSELQYNNGQLTIYNVIEYIKELKETEKKDFYSIDRISFKDQIEIESQIEGQTKIITTIPYDMPKMGPNIPEELRQK